MREKYFNICKYILVAFTVLTLTACGGGSGSDSSTPTLTPKQSSLDTTAPVITINGDKTVQLNLGDSYTELGASAKDETDGEVIVSISGAINLNQLGTYTFTYTATDSAGNSASLQRTIIVVAPEDTIAPIVTLNGGSKITLSYGVTYQELGATATDNLDETVEITIIGQVDINTPNIYTITYTATDKAGNIGNAAREVTVLPQQDITPPVLSLNGENYNKLFINDSYVELGAIAIDDFDGQLPTTSSGLVNTETVGVYTVIYTATDKAGNSASIERTIDVVIPRPFITTWKTGNVVSGSSDEYTIKIDTIDDGYNFQVDWGDGNIDNNVINSISHRYQSTGTYTVKITGDFPRFYLGEGSTDRSKLISIEQWGDLKWTSMKSAFFGSSNLIVNALDAPDLSRVSDLSYMFSGATSFNQDISHWDVSNVTDMSAMFQNTSSFNQNIGIWAVSNVKYMSYMFNGATNFNQPVGDWDVSSLKDMLHMFNGAINFNQPLGNWDVSQVYKMTSAFAYAEAFNQDIGDWDTSEVFYMGKMFNGASSFNQDIGRWDVSHVAYMNSLFKNATTFDQNLRNWDISNLVDMRSMFQGIALSVDNYNALLQGWSVLPNPPKKIGFHAGNSKYSQAGKAARDILTDIYEWNIADGGQE
jgi:surface protein